MDFMGYRKRTGCLAGLTVAQIGEFSLILAALGLSRCANGDWLSTAGAISVAVPMIVYGANVRLITLRYNREQC